MSASSPTTEITLHQMVLRVGDAAPEGHVFETHADALVEAARSARQHLDQFWEIDARNILDDGDRRTDPIVDLALVADDECIRLANAWDGASFEAVRRQNIRHNSRRRLAECGPRQGVDVRRRTCGAASADVRWSVA